MRSEINPIPLMHKLADQGAHLALPVVRGAASRFCFAPGVSPAARAGRGHSRAEGRRAGGGADVLLVPLAAVTAPGIGSAMVLDTRSHPEALRAKKKIVVVGVATLRKRSISFRGTHDQALDYVLTETGVAARQSGARLMRFLFFGDWWAAPAACGDQTAAGVIKDWKLEFVAINGENAAGVFGITEAIYTTWSSRLRRHHARQPFLGPARCAGVHRAGAEAIRR